MKSERGQIIIMLALVALAVVMWFVIVAAACKFGIVSAC